MMGPGDAYGSHLHVHHHPGNHPIPMDLHVPQGFPYYRYRNEDLAWSERQTFDQSGRFPPNAPAVPILELRKEKSRDAARSRRGKENYEFYELAKMLPLPPAITSQLDKASIIRLTISYLRLKDFSAHGDPPWVRENPTQGKKGNVRSRSLGNATLDLFEQHIGTHILQSLDGFAFSLAADGRFLYISETVSIYLGLSQVEMTGSSVFDYIHQADHSELAEQLGLGLAHGAGANVPSPSGSEDGSSNSATNNPDVSSLMSITSNLGYKGMDRAFCIRMKSTLTKRGCHFKSSGYRVVLVLCRLRPQYSFSHTRKAPPPLLGMVALAIALPPPSVHEIRLETDMFVTRLSFDFKIIHCEPRVSELLDYSAEELMGRNLYSLCHAEDVNKLRKCHVDLLAKGQVMSQYYRLMNKSGGYVWIQSCATVVSNSKNADEQSIICVNYVISGREFPHVVMDCCQLDQECVPLVKTEVVEERDGKSPDQDSPDGRGREGSGGLIDSSRPAGVRAGPTLGRSPEQREGCVAKERRGNSAPRTVTASRIPDEQTQPLEPQHRLTPISATPERTELARTPIVSRPIDAEIFPPALPPQPTKSTKGRKRKGDRINGKCATAGTTPVDTLDAPQTHAHSNHQHPCNSKRQVIVSSDVMDHSQGNGSPTPHHHHNNTSNASNNHNHVEAENASEVARWRKVQSQAHWEAVGGSSVKDLEQVMSKHLPGRDSENAAIVSSGIDFSADSLLRQPTCSRTGSAIQWVGAGAQSSTGLPVSALLRQLCASRESVIRANVQATLAAARGASSYYPDMSTVQSALPTPPGSDNYGEQFMLANHHHASTTHQKSNSDFSSLVPYSTVSSYDYQPAMTPPASVSPRDKPPYPSVTSDPATYGDPGISSNSSFRPPQSYLDGPAQPLPLKPQVYGYHPHAGLDSQYPLAEHSQTQFYPPPHTGFHLYHPAGKSNPYGDALKSSNWYSTAS